MEVNNEVRRPHRRREVDFLIPECFIKDSVACNSGRRFTVILKESLSVPNTVEQ